MALNLYVFYIYVNTLHHYGCFVVKRGGSNYHSYG